METVLPIISRNKLLPANFLVHITWQRLPSKSIKYGTTVSHLKGADTHKSL